MVIQFTLQDLIYLLVGVLGVSAGILLLSILWNIKKIVGTLRPMVETNQEFINESIRTMPVIFENVGHISSNVRETTDKLRISVPVILDEVEAVTNASKVNIDLAGVVMENVSSGITETLATYEKNTSDFMNYFHIIEEVLQILYSRFTSKK